MAKDIYVVRFHTENEQTKDSGVSLTNCELVGAFLDAEEAKEYMNELNSLLFEAGLYYVPPANNKFIDPDWFKCGNTSFWVGNKGAYFDVADCSLMGAFS